MKRLTIVLCIAIAIILAAPAVKAASFCFKCESDSNWYGSKCVGHSDLSPGEGGSMCSNEQEWRPTMFPCGTEDDTWNPSGGDWTEYWCLNGRWNYRLFTCHLAGNACPPFEYQMGAAEEDSAGYAAMSLSQRQGYLAQREADAVEFAASLRERLSPKAFEDLATEIDAASCDLAEPKRTEAMRTAYRTMLAVQPGVRMEPDRDE